MDVSDACGRDRMGSNEIELKTGIIDYALWGALPSGEAATRSTRAGIPAAGESVRSG